MVRDLDKLRTRSEFRLRTGHLALIVLATAVAVGLLFVVGNAMAGTDDADAAATAAVDPFAGLQQSATAEKAAPEPPRKPPALAAVPAPETLPPLALTFHDRLARPADALPGPVAAPATAEAVPTRRDPGDDAPLPIESPTVHQPQPPMPVAAPAPAPAPLPIVAPAPTPAPAASVPATPPPNVPMAPPPVQSAREPLAPALPPGSPQPRFDEEPNPPLAQAGERGVFTLQVASFALQDEAVAYMNMLRQRGHESFIVRADCGERGLLYRVRVGPFDSQAEAERYRRKFERTERIPTFVVRRTRPEPTALPGTL